MFSIKNLKIYKLIYGKSNADKMKKSRNSYVDIKVYFKARNMILYKELYCILTSPFLNWCIISNVHASGKKYLAVIQTIT